MVTVAVVAVCWSYEYVGVEEATKVKTADQLEAAK